MIDEEEFLKELYKRRDKFSNAVDISSCYKQLNLLRRSIKKLQKDTIPKLKVEKALNDNPLFSDRKKIVEEFKKWAKENKVEESSFNLVTWFDSKIRNYLLKGLGL